VKSIHILLPLFDNGGRRIAGRLFELTSRELADRFGGLTAHTRAPVEGLWKRGRGTQRDDLVIFEVNAPRFERRWWREYRARLERRFRQEKVLVRVFDFMEP
jgi:hypothetical protein